MRDTRPTVYLAGPITGCNYKGATDWREAVSRELALSTPPIVGVSPMRGKEYLKSLTAIGGTSDEVYARERAICTPRAIVTRDRWDVRTCDAVLMNLLGATRVSIGTMIEAGWADAARVPVVLVREDDNVHSHMMLDEIAGYRTTTLEEAVDLVRILFSRTQ